jgi:glycosyltransferase involved in cell wall biosynthesis
MRFHIPSIPHTVTSKEHSACAFTQNIVNFCAMMSRRGCEIIHYGHEDSVLECAELVPVISRLEYKRLYSDLYDFKKNQYTTLADSSELYTMINQNTIKEVSARKKPGDFLLIFGGFWQLPIADHHSDMIVVEPAIGYPSAFASYRVYPSYASLHYHCNDQNHQMNYYHTVIPHYFDESDFQPEPKEDYMLFVGRLNFDKGYTLAIDITKRLGIKLKIAGQGCIPHDLPDNVEVLGYVGVDERKRLMAKARALIMPTLYMEPFGCVVIESLMSGTPVISNDWGGPGENNIHGVTGYKCRTFEQFMWAAKNIDKIDTSACRSWAIDNFSFDKVGSMYEEYFQSIANLYKPEGWYTLNNTRQNLDYLVKRYPVKSPKKKMALFLTGQARDLDDMRSYNSIKTHLLDKYDCTIFSHYWHDSGEKMMVASWNTYEYKYSDDVHDVITRLYNPKVQKYDNSIEKRHTEHNLYCIESMNKSIKLCSELFDDGEYDVFFRMRYDGVLEEVPDYRMLDDTNLYFPDHYGDKDWLADNCVISRNCENFLKCMKLHDHFDSILETGVDHFAESILHRYMNTHNIPYNVLPLTVFKLSIIWQLKSDVVLNCNSIETDSSEYNILTDAVKAVRGVDGMTCEIGLRAGGGTKMILDTLKSSGQSKMHIAIDPYGNIEYEHWETRKERLDYTNKMKTNALRNLYTYCHDNDMDFIFFPMEDSEFFLRYSDGVPLYNEYKTICNSYSLVFFDGPHTTASVLTEFMFFSDKIPPGGIIVFDDINQYPHYPSLDAVIQSHNFKEIERGAVKVSYQKCVV